ncbi:type ISP restriction/modification enzyme, partial [Oceanithermus sp.]
MPEALRSYLEELTATIKRGDYREESFYPALERLLEELGSELGHPRLDVTVLPKKTEAGNPDFRVWDGASKIIGYVEAKKPGENLEAVAQSEQLERYRSTFPNVVLTDFFHFLLYRDGVEIARATLAQPQPALLGRTPPVQDEEGFLELLRRFYDYSLPQKLKAKPLAERLARLTRFLRDQVIATELAAGEESPLTGFLDVFKRTLIADLSPDQFADLFAQTLTYGMFAARIRAEGEFNRKLAYDYIPRTLGVLREVFRYISLVDLPKHLEVTLDEIAAVLQAADVGGILREYQQTHHSTDPIVHFYETFLAEYDPTLRERRGVYYTPEPVVRYIVNSVHAILKNRFGARSGLADGERPVTLLDPAAGTLTFPAMAVERAAEEYRATWGEAGVQGMIKDHVLPHYYAFELMMAPYAIGHLKMGLVLEALGYRMGAEERFNLYLTNTLEMETLPGSAEPLLSALSLESRLAGEVKQEKPILVILGNPPYSGHSANRNAWTERLLKDDWPDAPSYFKVDGEPLGERNPKWLQDDYVKFLRFAQWKVAQHGEGVVAMITNHSYLDNPTFRGMRQSLLTTFDEIYILNLHGNAKKKETAPDGSADENVFDIQQGVAIGLFIKHPDAAEKKVHYANLWGKRKEKYDWLSGHDVDSTKFAEIRAEPPFYFFVPRATEGLEHYREWPRVDEAFPVHSVGIVTARDKLTIAESREEMLRRLRQVLELEPEIVGKAYGLAANSVSKARSDLDRNGIQAEKVVPILYRPFDRRWTYFSTGGFLERPREDVMRNLLAGPNIALLSSRQVKSNQGWANAYISRFITDHSLVSNKTSEISQHFPLYLYLEPTGALFAREAFSAPCPKSGPELFGRFLSTLAYRTFRTPLAHVVEINPADLFRLVAGPHGGLEGATGPEEALSRLISGAAQPDDIRGYDPERACNLHEFAGVVLEPARIFESKQEPGRWLYVRELRGSRVWVAEFREVGGGRLSLTEFRLQDAVDLEAEPLEVKWTPADPSRPAGSAGLSGGEAPSPGSSSNVYATSWTERRPNLDPEIWASLTARMGRPVSPEEFLAYVYAVLYTPAYREKYAEFLRVDFPRVPLPESESTFSAFAGEGARL